MTKAATISIDGQEYDAFSGLRVSPDESTDSHEQPTEHIHSETPASILHSKVQHSTTLRRHSLHSPTPAKLTIVGHHSTVKHMDISRPQRSANIHKFAPHPVGALKPRITDIGPAKHAGVTRAHELSAAKAQPLTRSLTALEIKNQAIKTAISKTHRAPSLKSKLRPRQRIVAVLSATFAVVLLGGYFTYLNMPSLSVRVAAAQAGIDANYPNYRPDGYALNGPVTYSSGRVSMNFKANGGSSAFTIAQSKSGWDSSALLDNYVSPRAGSNYVPYTEQGLTIYTYANNAAWVNGGILYTIQGNAPLSSSQIREIATSLL